MRSNEKQVCTFYDNFSSAAIDDFPADSGKTGCPPNYYKLIGISYCLVFLPGFYDPEAGS